MMYSDIEMLGQQLNTDALLPPSMRICNICLSYVIRLKKAGKILTDLFLLSVNGLSQSYFLSIVSELALLEEPAETEKSLLL